MMTTAPQRTEAERWRREESLPAASGDVWAWPWVAWHHNKDIIKLLKQPRQLDVGYVAYRPRFGGDLQARTLQLA
jgi:hypothetical protein